MLYSNDSLEVPSPMRQASKMPLFFLKVLTLPMSLTCGYEDFTFQVIKKLSTEAIIWDILTE
jgi:hypothetical protein